MADLDLILGMNKASKWTRDEFQAMDRKDLRFFATWNGDATVKWPKHYDAMVTEKGFGADDAALAFEVYNSSTTRTTMNSRPDAYLVTQGGSFTYTPAKVSYFKLSGEKVERSNAPIPARFGEGDKFSNLVAVSAFCAQLVEVEDAAWKVRLNVEAFAKVYKGSELNVPGLMKVAARIRAILDADKVWLSLPYTTKASVTGEEMLCFVREAIGRLTKDAYDALNTVIVCNALNTFKLTEKGWAYRMNEDGKRMIPPECYEAVEPSRTLKDKLKDVAGCYWYKGGLMIRALYPEFDGTLVSLTAIVARAREVQGSNTSPTAILAGMKGYSGLTDAFGKRMQFVLATTLGLWAQNRKVNVRVDTVGDVTMLVSSLNLWSQKIRNSPNPLFVTMVEGQEARVACYFRIVLSTDMDKQNLNVRYHEYIVPSIEEDAVVVYHHTGSLPTAGSKGQVVDYDAQSFGLLPPVFHDREYVMYGLIYGMCPFANDIQVKRSVGNAMAKMQRWNRIPEVKAFGTASNFQGVMTTVKNLQLVGWGYASTGAGKWDERMMDFQTISLMSISTQREWYERVAIDVKAVTVAWLNPISRYSPISNLPYVSKTGVTFALERVESEQGVLIGNILAVPSQGKVVVDELVSRFIKEEREVAKLPREPEPQEQQQEEEVIQNIFDMVNLDDL